MAAAIAMIGSIPEGRPGEELAPGAVDKDPAEEIDRAISSGVRFFKDVHTNSSRPSIRLIDAQETIGVIHPIAYHRLYIGERVKHFNQKEMLS